MTRSDIAMQFGVAAVLVVAGATPIALTFEPVVRIIAAIEGTGARWPSVFLANQANHSTAMLIVLACILCLSVGLTLGVVSVGRLIDFATDKPIVRRRQLVRTARG